MKADWKLAAAGAVLLAGCSTVPTSVSDAEVTAAIKASFAERGVAKLDRLDQSPMQQQCSAYSGKEIPKSVKEAIEKEALAAVKYPADGKFIGDWKAGERIAQSGRGLQFSDTAKTVAGGNCYACHQLSKEEISYGNLGPTLYQYGKLRGYSEATVRYTWARIWNSHAFSACNHMPRFGAAGILNEQQLKDVMALLLDPASPVNR